MVLGFCQLAAGLDIMHEQGIVHQDLHCGNVLLNADGLSWKLADLGSGARTMKDGEPNWIEPTKCR